MKRFVIGAMLVGLMAGVGNVPAQAKNDKAFMPNEVLIQFKDGTTAAQQDVARGKVKSSKAEKIRSQGNGATKLELASLPADVDVATAINTLKGDASVEFAEPNYVYTTELASIDPFFTNGSLWGMYGATTSPVNQYGSNAAAAWAAGNTGSANVYVGVIDEGIQNTHPDLTGQIWTNPFDAADGADNDGNGYIDDVNGWDFANNDRTIYDGGNKGSLDDHGTHVAGTIGAKNNGAGVVGVNWNVTMISGKFLGRNGGTTANAVRATDYFTDLKTRHGLNIVATSNSWGGGGFSQALYDSIERANRAGILFVAAAGNSAVNNDSSPHYPSSYANSNIISVASITNTGAMSSFSNYGATSVDIGAPGSAIYSTTASNQYESYSGTSMATPHVTGAVALYKSVNPSATAAQIKSAILSSAVPTASLSGKTVTGGRLDANAALSR